MLTISAPLSAAQAKAYHALEFANGRENYYTQGGEIVGQWHGRLAADWGLVGDASLEHYNRLADGQHPITTVPLVKHQTKHLTTTATGQKVSTMEHRAGWDCTFSAPKSTSVTALVAGDERVARAHDAAVDRALDVALQPYTQARLGGNIPAETTGNFIAVKFAHNSARPVDGYSAPQVHTHVVLFNMTKVEGDDVRPVQPRELFRTQQYATAVYRSELASRLTELGYQIERGKSGEPTIVGYSPEYLEASSPRRTQIEERLAALKRSGAAAAQVAAHQTREKKVHLTPEEVRRQHQELAIRFGNQPAHVREAASQRPVHLDPRRITADAAVSFSKARNIERDAVMDERHLLRDALVRSMGDRTVDEIRAHFADRAATPEFVPIDQKPGVPGRHYSTPEMIALERDNIRLMREAQEQRHPLASADIRRDIQDHYPHLNAGQLAAVERVLASRDGVQELDGVAGAGKTTALAAVRDAAERAGYRVQGFAPTSRAADLLHDAGIDSKTLQRHLAQTPDGDERRQRHLYVLDESSLSSTVQVHQFLKELNGHDRVILVGDGRQHEAIDAGIPYQQLQRAGISIARLSTIVRQQDPELRGVVELLAEGKVAPAIQALDDQGRVLNVEDRDDRFAAIAADYATDPKHTLVVSPDNESRADLNGVIHQAMQVKGHVEAKEHPVRVLVARQELTGADRQWASRYEVDDVVRYTKASKLVGVKAGDYARVLEVRPDTNQIRIRRDSGGTVTYDPRRAHGVTVYQESERQLAVGDRLQFTAPDRRMNVANRQLAIVEAIGPAGELRITLDKKDREVVVDSVRKHVDLGYVLTSHSSQGQTADRVLVHVDTDQAGERLVNRRMAYVSLSRGRLDARIYTNDSEQLVHALSRDVSRQSALRPDQVQTPAATEGPRQQQHAEPTPS